MFDWALNTSLPALNKRYFYGEFEKSTVIFKISNLELFSMQSFMQK